MTQHPSLLKYPRLRSQLSRYDHSQILDRLLEEIQENEVKTLKIIHLENRILELQNQLNSVLSFSDSKSSKLKKLRTSHDMKGWTEEGLVSKKELQKWQNKVKQLNQQTGIFTKQTTLMREEFKSKYDQLLESLKGNTRTIEDLTYKNNLLKDQLQEAVADITVLTSGHDQSNHDIDRLRNREDSLLVQNQLLMEDSTLQIRQYQRSVDIIKRLFGQLDQLRRLHEEKSILLKQATEKVSYLQLHLEHCKREGDKYEKTVRENSRSAIRHLEEVRKMEELRIENQLTIIAIDRDNNSLREALELEKKATQINQEILKETRDRNTVLQRKLVPLEESDPKLKRLASEKEKQLEDLKGAYEYTTSSLRSRVFELQEQNSVIRQQLTESTQLFKVQVETQQKVINEFQKTKRAKVLDNLKEKFKGEEKHKEFRLGEFQMKLQLDQLDEGDDDAGEERRTTGGNDALSEKTIEMTERINARPH